MNSTYQRFVTGISVIAIVGAVFLGCKTQITNPAPDKPIVPYHAIGWTVVDSSNFHGLYVKQNGFLSCSECHGITSYGGSSGISCLNCHNLTIVGCTGCHGGKDNASGAPPYSIHHDSLATDLGVGAHSAHLAGKSFSDGAPCQSCHTVPIAIADKGHFGEDSIAELTFSGISGASSTWTRATATCAQTYCHGNFTGGDATTKQIWNAPGSIACGSCHDDGTTPALLAWKHEFHIIEGGLQCADCHATVVDTGKQIIGKALHVNGQVEFAIRDSSLCASCHGGNGVGCTSCHGGIDNQTGAPPKGLRGETATTQRAVGAHTSHVDGNSLTDGILCSDCHKFPTSFTAPGHLGPDSVAELTFSALAGGSSNWNRITNTCTNSYCHGNFSGGKPANAPIWTNTNQAACGSCHDVGADAASLGWKHDYHVNGVGLYCNECHASVVGAGPFIVGPSLHVNGIVDTMTRDTLVCNVCHKAGGMTCTACHGGIDNQTGAPPHGLRGETTTNQRAVGAHSAHLDGKSISDGIACEDCHVVPPTVAAPSHMGPDSIAELTFSAYAGNSSTWTRASNTCTNTYCHGNFAGGKAANAPVWTGTNQAICGSCHDVGSDASLLLWKHDVHVNVAGLKCTECHYSVVDSSLNIKSMSRHIDGGVDTLTRNPAVCAVCHDNSAGSCIRCHGGIDDQTGAPPKGLRGETITTQRAVGAHSVHLSGNTMSNGFACTECHKVPATVTTAGHLAADSLAEMTWGPITGNATVWTRATNRCANSYCHGNFSGGKSANAPLWTGSNQAACGSCHDVGTNPSQLGGRHDKHVSGESIACYRCHNATVNSSNTITGKAVHINRQNTVQFSAGGNYTNGTCSSIGCHDPEQW